MNVIRGAKDANGIGNANAILRNRRHNTEKVDNGPYQSSIREVRHNYPVLVIKPQERLQHKGSVQGGQHAAFDVIQMAIICAICQQSIKHICQFLLRFRRNERERKERNRRQRRGVKLDEHLTFERKDRQSSERDASAACLLYTSPSPRD